MVDSVEDPNFVAELDARGLLCPLPVLKLRKRISALRSGDHIRVETDDPAAVLDVPHFCAEQGHSLLSQESTEKGCKFLIKKA
ncbi:MAG: sulfurtransferase TusA family protein [Pseudomonadota bacterium]